MNATSSFKTTLFCLMVGLTAQPVLAADPVSLADQFGQGLDTAVTRQFGEVQAKAERDGKVRVIVHLTHSAIPAGKLSAQARLEQRASIAQAQTEILSTVTTARPGSIKRFKDIPYLAMEVDTATLEQLRASQEIKAITEDKIARASLQQSVPLIGGTNAWAAGYSGADQAVAVLDTGVDKHYPFLAGKVVAEACFSTSAFDQFFQSACPNGEQEQIGVGAGVNCAADDCDHGTHVAGIAAGAAGVAKGASIIAVQVFTLSSSQEFCGFFAPCTLAFYSDILKGMEFVYGLRNRLKIASVNLSLGGARKYTEPCAGFPDVEPIRVAAENLRSAGIATVFVAGNDGFKDGLSAPACLSNVISVGATYKADFVADFSNSSRLLSLLAPGVNIISSIPGGDQQGKSGTSMAAPHVAGAWAVLKSKRPTATVDEILSALSRTGVPISDDWNQIVKPRIQIDAALNTLAGTSPPGPPPPPAPLTPLSPSGSITTSTPTYRWMALQDSSWYLVWLYDQNGALVYTSYVAPFDAGCSGKATACAHTPNRRLSIGKSYSWYVSAVKGIRVFDSTKLSFTVVR